MTRYLTHSAAAFAAIVLAFSSIASITAVPGDMIVAGTQVATVAAPVLA